MASVDRPTYNGHPLDPDRLVRATHRHMSLLMMSICIKQNVIRRYMRYNQWIEHLDNEVSSRIDLTDEGKRDFERRIQRLQNRQQREIAHSKSIYAQAHKVVYALTTPKVSREPDVPPGQLPGT